MKLKNKKVVQAWKFKDYLFNAEHIMYLKRIGNNKYVLMLKKEHRRDKRVLPKKTKHLYSENVDDLIEEIEDKVIKEKSSGSYEVLK